MRIALAQIRSTIDPRENLILVTDTTHQAVRGGADVVVFPEATMCSFRKEPSRVAEPFDGPWASAVRSLAGDLGVTIIAGMFTTTTAGRVHNTLLVTGGAEARYDKIHLFDALSYRESATVAPGRRSVAVDIAGLRVGLAVCYDIRFPAHFISLAHGGATVMVVCASWAPGPGKLHQWRTLATARAMDSTSFVVAVDQAFSDDVAVPGKPTGIGHSMVVDPAGTVILELGGEPDLAFIDLSPDRVVSVREALPVLEGNSPQSL